MERIKLKYATKRPKTLLGVLLCKVGLHRWKYSAYRHCKRCGRHQTLYEYGYFGSGITRWED